MIKFENVVHRFGKKSLTGDHIKTVLNGIDFALKRGEILCLLGPSGCGKTTMVNLIMGNLVPSEGTVTVMGEQAPYKSVRKKIGYMPQEDALYHDITAMENLIFFGRMNGMKGSGIRNRAKEMLEFGRLEEDGKKMTADFSGGMKRRLSLGIAMIHDPDMLILDEPTVGLDPDHRKRIWDEFDQMAEKGKTILVTTHVMDEAERCGKIAMLYRGKITATGSPSEIRRQTGCSTLEEAFIALENQSNQEVGYYD